MGVEVHTWGAQTLIFLNQFGRCTGDILERLGEMGGGTAALGTEKTEANLGLQDMDYSRMIERLLKLAVSTANGWLGILGAVVSVWKAGDELSWERGAGVQCWGHKHGLL